MSVKGKRPVIAALILVIALFVFRTYFLAPRSEAMQEDIRSQYKVLQKYEGFMQGAHMTEEEIQSILDETADLENRLVEAKSEFLAAALLQEEIAGLSSKAGLNIMTMRPMSASKTEKYLIIPVFLEGHGSIKQVSEFLRNLESDKYLMKIDKLNISITNVQNPRDLKVKIQISGLARA